MKMYDQQYYSNRHKSTVYSADRILSVVLQAIPKTESAVDVGCGVGTWLSVLNKKGVKKIIGIDGNWVGREHLVIPHSCFIEHDLTKKMVLNDKYDLAISLEVAEHLPVESAVGFVEALTRLSDFVLFSAAIPYQGGRGHVNEQWPEYWINIFRARSFVPFDFIRHKIWDEADIPAWYKQNILLFVNEEKISLLRLPGDFTPSTPMSMVHPDIYINHMWKNRSELDRQATVSGSFEIFCIAIKRWIRKKLHALRLRL